MVQPTNKRLVTEAALPELARDIIGSTLVAGTGATVTVNDAGDTITIGASSGSAYTDEQVRDVIGATLVAGANTTVTVNDAGDTITIASTGVGGSSASSAVVFKPESYADLSNLSTNAGAAIQAAINAAFAAGGGDVYIGNRRYICDGYTIVLPSSGALGVIAPSVNIVGAGKNAELHWGTDLGANTYAVSCGDPTATLANGLGRYGVAFYNGEIRNVNITGPGYGTTTTLGVAPATMHGYAAGARRNLKNVIIAGFNRGIDWVGDNIVWDYVTSTQNYFGVYYNVQSTYLYGDIVYTKCFFENNTMAGIGVNPDAQGIKGANFNSCYLGQQPYGIMLESGGANSFPTLIGDVIFDNCMFEGVGNAAIFDDNFTTTVPKGAIVGMDWRKSLSSWKDSKKLTTGGRTRVAQIVMYAMQDTTFTVPRNPAQWGVPGDIGLWSIITYKGVKIIADFEQIFPVLITAAKPWLVNYGATFSADTITWEMPGKYGGTFFRLFGGGTAPAQNDIVTRIDYRARRSETGTSDPVAGIAAMGGAVNTIIPVTTWGEKVTVNTSGTVVIGTYLKKDAGYGIAASSASDGVVFGWVKTLPSGSTAQVALIPAGGGGGGSGTAGQGFTFRGAWAASTAYAAYDVLTYLGQTYVVVTAFTSTSTFDATNLSLWAAKGGTGQGFNYRGAWAASTAYALYDVLTYLGTTYIVTTAFTSGTTFSATNLTVWAAKGDQGVAAPGPSAEAALHGLLGLTAATANAAGSPATNVGRVEYTKCLVPGGSTLNNVVYTVVTAGVAVSAYIGVYSAAGTLLGQTADIGSSLTAAGSVVSPLTSAVTLPSGDTYVFLAILVGSASTAPVLQASVNGGNTATMNMGLTATQGYRAFYTTVSAVTTLPSTVTLSSGTATNRIFVLGVK